MLGSVFLLLTSCLLAAPEDDAIQAIRNNDIAQLRKQLGSGLSASARDKRGVPLLMHAAFAGSVESVQTLLDARADVNAANGFGATALMWAMGEKAKVRMLVAAGADVNAKSKMSRTPLLIAACHDGYADILRLLLDKGADPKALNERGGTVLSLAARVGDAEMIRLLLSKGLDAKAPDKGGGTALLGAASAGSVEGVKLLLAAGADVNASNGFSGEVKKGPIALTRLTPLHLAAANGPPELVKLLLDAGANVNAADVRGMTPLMLAHGTDHYDPAIVRLLLAKGTDVNAKSTAQETALDWALKFRNPAMLEILRKAGAKPGAPWTAPAATQTGSRSPRQAIEASIPLLTKSNAKFFEESGCMGCHHQSLTVVALTGARRRGIAVDDKALEEFTKTIRLGLPQFTEAALQRIDTPAGADIFNYAALPMAAAGRPAADFNTDAMASNVAALQWKDGSWGFGGVTRPPIEDGPMSATALSIHTLRTHGSAGRKQDFDARIAKARQWLLKAKPVNTEQHAMQLLGLYWAGAMSKDLAPFAAALRKMQRSDGGWAQTVHLDSDAYATGLVLWALVETKVEESSSKLYQRGTGFLVRSQKVDGSWYVRSRAPKFQPYFESGFPYGHDQWISASATAWAVAALSNVVTPEVKSAP